ncbi:MAG TPA: ABC transporter permease [Bacteroidales bacterium]|jgi:ribose transport system permease protein|nr:ribose ABC transporter permease [Bacteroidales bacterium]OQB62105.1 MAG: Ribose transport system permease protein RbsC [Bacteroidetes bacterium ADurb.Bin145]NMD03287.1 ABC transporter permease [Bacteroidales bacterium]HOU00894.1 ABC transporter permease [Bacteroidales bacterium]HQG62029.1 ABC transporter permease [Bacteroidales bacterium]
MNKTGTASIWQKYLRIREVNVFMALVVLIIIMSAASPYFLKQDNIFNVLRGMSTIGIMALGQTMVIITGGIDLSVGSLLAVSSMLTARLITVHDQSAFIAVLTGLSFGLFLGIMNGLIITRFKINAFITTLGMLSIGRGLTYLLATGVKGSVASNIPMQNGFIVFLGNGYLGPVPFSVVLLLILLFLASLFLRHTVPGRYIYAVGSNERSARLSGVPVNKVRVFVYAISGFFCALAGIILTGRLSTAATNIGLGNELDVIAAVVIGGASLQGGEGTVTGAIIGATIMAIVRNAFVLLHIPNHFQTITIGIVIILAVGFDQLLKRKVKNL